MFKGSFTALITPFKGDEVDEEAYARLIEWQIAQGSHGLVPVGTTGESPTLSHDEHRRTIELCIETAAGRVPVIAGTGSNSTAEAIDFTQHAKQAGADGALVVTPYYNKPTQEGLFQHYKTLNDCADIPILIYNIPGRSVIDMSVETMARLFELPNIVGVKDATANMARASQQRAAMGPDFVQLSGEDATALGFMAHGGTGCISVTAKYRAAALRGLPECLPGRRLRQGSRDSRPPHAGARRAVRRVQSWSGQICRLVLGSVQRRDAHAPGAVDRRRPQDGRGCPRKGAAPRIGSGGLR